jgi:hypothetical protein
MKSREISKHKHIGSGTTALSTKSLLLPADVLDSKEGMVGINV